MSAQGFQAQAPAGAAQLSSVVVDGTGFCCRIDGDAALPTLLLSNSLGTNLSMWDAQIPALTRRFRVVRYDSRGHGGSQVTPAPYMIEQLGRDVIGLLDALDVDRCHFCGLSMGGMVGMWLGANADTRIDRLVLCNTAPRIGPADVWNARIDRVRAGGMEAIADAVLERWFSKPFRERAPDVMRGMRAMLVATPTEGYTASCAAVRDMDQWDQLARVRRPTLIVAGTHDLVTTPADGRRMVGEISGSKYVELDASHISNIEAPDHFTAELMQFLTR